MSTVDDLGLDHADCRFSSGYADLELTAGQGELDQFGYWDIPCPSCVAKVMSDQPLPKKEVKEEPRLIPNFISGTSGDEADQLSEAVSAFLAQRGVSDIMAMPTAIRLIIAFRAYQNSGLEGAKKALQVQRKSTVEWG